MRAPPPARTLLAASLALALGATAARAASVTVLVEGTVPGGEVRVSLCTGGLDPRNCPVGDSASARAETARFVFPEVGPGLYAAAAFQDLNGNGQLDRTPVGVPLEPYAFSNGVGRTAPPRFERAAFRVHGNTVVRLKLDLPPTQR